MYPRAIKLFKYCILTFDIDVNGGECDMKNITMYRGESDMKHGGELRTWYIWSKIWLMKKIWKVVYLVFLELGCFSSMLPSMPKGEIVSMNFDDIPMGEYHKKGYYDDMLHS